MAASESRFTVAVMRDWFQKQNAFRRRCILYGIVDHPVLDAIVSPAFASFQVVNTTVRETIERLDVQALETLFLACVVHGLSDSVGLKSFKVLVALKVMLFRLGSNEPALADRLPCPHDCMYYGTRGSGSSSLRSHLLVEHAGLSLPLGLHSTLDSIEKEVVLEVHRIETEEEETSAVGAGGGRGSGSAVSSSGRGTAGSLPSPFRPKAGDSLQPPSARSGVHNKQYGLYAAGGGKGLVQEEDAAREACISSRGARAAAVLSSLPAADHQGSGKSGRKDAGSAVQAGRSTGKGKGDAGADSSRVSASQDIRVVDDTEIDADSHGQPSSSRGKGGRRRREQAHRPNLHGSTAEDGTT